nr:hypothetical protein [Parafrankia soli]
MFLWAFLDKTFGLGHDTASADAWTNGGSPTQGFLGSAATGPFRSIYHSLAGTAFADVLFMVALLTIGAALTPIRTRHSTGTPRRPVSRCTSPRTPHPE